MKSILTFLLALLIYSPSFSQPCMTVPNFKNSKESINWVENTDFNTKDWFYSSNTEDWLFEAVFYSCDGKKGFLIVGNESGEKYISGNVELRKWKKLKSSNNIGKFYAEKIRPNEKYYYYNAINSDNKLLKDIDNISIKMNTQDSSTIPCNDPPSFIDFKEAIEWVKKTKFHMSDFHFSNENDLFSTANYYSCDGLTGYLILLKQDGKEYILDQLEISKWNGLKNSDMIFSYYNEEIYGNVKYTLSNNFLNNIIEKAELGDTSAQYKLAKMYHEQIDLLFDNERGLFWLKKAAEQGHADAQCDLGTISLANSDLRKVEEGKLWLKKAAEQGHANAQYMLGSYHLLCYSLGLGNAEEGKFWIREGAKNNDRNAQYSLGRMFYNGEMTLTDKKQAIHWFQKAAEKGQTHAQYDLGRMFYSGEGTLTDKKQAIHWFHKAAEKGHADAQYNLGIMFYYGEGTLMDKKQAAKWIRAAYENGFEKAKETWDKKELWKYE